MQNKLIVITGYLASGKSTFARTLSERLRVPCFIKDTMKIALCESLGPISKTESSRFSAVTFFSIGGETVAVDTSDFSRVDFDALCEKAAVFLGKPLPTGDGLC